MSKQNKVLCNLDQQLTELQKYTARTNIGAFGMYDIQPTSTTHTIDQTEAMNGQFFFSKSTVKSGLYLLSVHLYIAADGTAPSDSIVPLWVTVRRNYSGGSTNAKGYYSADLTRLEQNNPWHGRLDMFQMITDSNIESMDFIVDFEPYKIPQDTPVMCDVSGVLIGNIEPTP